MEDDGFRRQFDAVLASVCRRAGVPVSGAELPRLNSNGLSPYIRKAPARAFARRELALRASTLQAGDRSARWNRPSPARPRQA